MHDPYNDAIANRYDYSSSQSVEFILSSLDYIQSQIESTGNNTRISVLVDVNKAINTSGLTDDEHKILYWYYSRDFTLETAAWETNISIGKASELKHSLLKKIFKFLNGDSSCH